MSDLDHLPWSQPDGELPEGSSTFQRRTMEDAQIVKSFLLAGNSTVTLVSKATGDRYTYKVEAAKEKGAVSHFVKLLTDPDNERGYTYLGHIYRRDGNYWHGQKSKIGYTALSAEAFKYFYRHVIEAGRSPSEVKLEVWHEGRCGKCNRKLTVPESIERGIGPECYSRM